MRLLADENFNNDTLRGLLRLIPDLDYVRVQDTEIYEADDPVVLEWAARENRILLTHDVKTMAGFAYERVAAGLPMPGVIEVNSDLPIGQAIEHLLVVIEVSEPGELENRVVFVPLH